MHRKIHLDIDFKQFLNAKYTEYETISIQIWNDSNNNSNLTQLRSPLPDTYCWENTKMKQIKNEKQIKKGKKMQTIANVKTIKSIFIEDWKVGHFLQCNDDVYTHWKCGDGLIVDRAQCHLSANAGVEDKHTVQVSGFMNV